MKAIRLSGGKSRLARRLTKFAQQSPDYPDITISHEVIHNWIVRGVPANRCRLIEEATGGRVTRYELHPEVFGPAPDCK